MKQLMNQSMNQSMNQMMKLTMKEMTAMCLKMIPMMGHLEKMNKKFIKPLGNNAHNASRSVTAEDEDAVEEDAGEADVEEEDVEEEDPGEDRDVSDDDSPA